MNGNRPAAQPSRALIESKHTVSDLLNSERAKTEIAKVLPKHLTAERMTRVALTATLKNPALLQCLPQSLMNALLVCSQAGLEPDGRLAHLILQENAERIRANRGELFEREALRRRNAAGEGDRLHATESSERRGYARALKRSATS